MGQVKGIDKKPKKSIAFIPQYQTDAASINLHKIVFVTDCIYPYSKGGREKRLHEISKRLAEMGYDVHIYTMQWWRDSQKSRIEDGVHLHALCKYYDMYHKDRRSIKQGIMFGFACFKLLRVKFDILDVDHMPFFPILSSWAVCCLRRRKFFGTWHEALSRQDWTSYMGQSGIIASLIERTTTHLPHTITAVSAQTQELLGSIHGRVKRVGLVGAGIDTELINTVEPASIQCDVLYVGRLVKDKNIHILIKAISDLAQKDPAIRCIIIGKGLEKNRLERLAARLNLQRNIIFLEPLAKASEIYAYMKAAKVFCLPSTREGFSIVTLEALGCGTPVVTVDSPMNAARHLIRDGFNGSIVPRTAKDLVGAISYWVSLSQKPNIASEVSEYDWQSVAKKQIEVYTS